MAKLRLPKLPGIGRGARARPVRPGARKRLRRQRIKRAAKDLGWSFLDALSGAFNTGLDVDAFRSEISGTDAASGNGGGGRDTAGDVGGLPAKVSPKKVSKKTNPNISTISKQLDELTQSIYNISAVTDSQYENIKAGIQNARRVEKEQLLENNTAGNITPAAGVGLDGSLAPLQSPISALIETVENLTQLIKDKNDDSNASSKYGMSDAFFDAIGIGDGVREVRGRRKATRAARSMRAARSFTAAKSLSSLTSGERRVLQTHGVKFSAAGAHGVGGRTLSKTALEGMLARGPAKAATTGIGSAVTKSAGLAGLFATRTKALAAGSASKLAPAAVKASVRKLAGPLLAKSVGSTALKSIPVAGAVAGIGFAVKRLIDGDVAGAGLDLASGLGGPLTAIPALIASIARDVYSGVYGVQPEQDAQFGSRIGIVTSSVKEMVGESLTSKVQKQTPPSQGQVDQALMPKSPAQASQTQAPPISTIPPPSGPATAPQAAETTPDRVQSGSDQVHQGIHGSVADAMKPSASATGKPWWGGDMKPESPKQDSRAAKVEPGYDNRSTDNESTKPGQPKSAGVIAPMPSTAQTGDDILQSSLDVSLTKLMGDMPFIIPGVTSVPLPTTATIPTTKSSARGMGDVHDPLYYDQTNITLQVMF